MKKIIFIILLVLTYQEVSKMRTFYIVQKAAVKHTKEFVITATMYNAVPSQCDSDPFLTAGMYKINPTKASEQKYIALSRDLIKRWGGEFQYGDMVKITGAGFKDGIYKVVDTMNKRFKMRMDFLETKGTRHYKFDNVKITKINSKNCNTVLT